MSSVYSVLCLSHDPAIIAAYDCGSPEAAAAVIAEGVEGHEHCDLMIGRYSSALVELGCPRSADRPDALRPGTLRCYHARTEWTDKDWLLLLAAAYQSTDPDMQKAIKAGHHGCLPWERLRRLRGELGITITEEPAVVVSSPPGSTAEQPVCATYAPPAKAEDSGYCAHCGMHDWKHQGEPQPSTKEQP